MEVTYRVERKKGVEEAVKEEREGGGVRGTREDASALPHQGRPSTPHYVIISHLVYTSPEYLVRRWSVAHTDLYTHNPPSTPAGEPKGDACPLANI